MACRRRIIYANRLALLIEPLLRVLGCPPAVPMLDEITILVNLKCPGL